MFPRIYKSIALIQLYDLYIYFGVNIIMYCFRTNKKRSIYHVTGMFADLHLTTL